MKNIQRRSSSKGFTLIEMVIILGIVGLLATLLVPQFNNVIDQRGAVRLIQSTADDVVDNFGALVVTTGVSANASANGLLRTNNTLADILVLGEDFVAAGFQNAYADTGVATMSRSVTTVTAPVQDTSAGVYEVRGYTLGIASSSTGTVQVTFSDVPSEIVERIVEARDPGTAFDAAVADSTGEVQYDVASANGTHNLTLNRTL